MINANEANALVNEYEAKMSTWRVTEAMRLIERAETNIVESATRGRHYATVGLCGFSDKQIVQIATDNIVGAGYKVTMKGNYFIIEW